jgi:5'(3')-deoxyribonucleotidase
MSSLRFTRSYSITNPSDEDHTSNGRCPNYALLWDTTQNNVHWPNGHDYFVGNGSDISDGTKELREILSERLRKGIITKNLLFCDLDGVLADFEKGVEEKFNKNVCDIRPSTLWHVINKSTTFFENLPWMPKGRELWERIKEYHPIILTGVPSGCPTASEQKKRWCQRELGPDVSVITCLTKDKAKYCFGRSILIDDRLQVLNSWKEKGGKCILHEEENLDTNLERIDKYMDYDVY